MDRDPGADPNRFVKRGIVAVAAINLALGGLIAQRELANAEADTATGGHSEVAEETTTTSTTQTSTTERPTTSTTTTPETTPPSGLPAYINRGPADRPFVSITIDDFEGTNDAECISRILDIGQEKGVRFTFFPTGNAIHKHADTGVFQRILDEGSEIGNHTQNHRLHMNDWPIEDIRRELTGAQNELNTALGSEHRMTLMRPPGGAGGQRDNPDPEMTQVLQEQGMSLVMWNSDPMSPAFENLPNREQAYIDALLAPEGDYTAENGEVILLHCQSFDMNYLPRLIDGLVERGLTPTTVTGMFTD